MDEDVDPARVKEIVQELLNDWDDFCRDGEMKLRPRRRKSREQIAVVLALTAHVHECARALLPYLPFQLTAAHAPVARTALETALTVMWIDKKPDAAGAFTNEEQRHRRSIATTMRAQGRLAEAQRVAHVGDEAWPSSAGSQNEARRFEQLTKEIGAEDVYLLYRILCGLTHPSVSLTDEYLIVDDAPVGFRFVPTPQPLQMSESLTWLLAASLLWSSRRVDYLEGSPRRSVLRRYGQELGTSPDAGSK
ncbi:hypothetical protein GCM10022415_29010 [Knoellia locipacati]|uniref:Uncharacterized protein n=1 Tax=Knoellia locipacati TaxID=882824 RepID=A0A512T4J6_9MICO|nr:DUF5677 domain-containing protein [Knoellia locipacati]GEQ15140.1 hypothetical protein KLO01_31870 [Knoellia locipacati]